MLSICARNWFHALYFFIDLLYFDCCFDLYSDTDCLVILRIVIGYDLISSRSIFDEGIRVIHTWFDGNVKFTRCTKRWIGCAALLFCQKGYNSYAFFVHSEFK